MTIVQTLKDLVEKVEERIDAMIDRELPKAPAPESTPAAPAATDAPTPPAQ